MLAHRDSYDFNMGINEDWLVFGDSLEWTLVEVQVWVLKLILQQDVIDVMLQ